ncbi:MAG: outer membrane protein assembly factor BamB family protein [Planctomycetota bacterium]
MRTPGLLAALVLAAASSIAGETVLTGAEWPMYKGNPGMTGVSADKSVKPPFKLLWSYRTDSDTSGDALSGPTVAGGMVFQALANTGSLLAIDAKDGKFLWEYAHRDFSSAKQPAYHDGKVFVWLCSWGRSTVVALNAVTGEELWLKKLNAKGVHGHRDGPIVYKGRLYLADGGDEPAVVALNPDSGEVVWRRKLGKADGLCVYTPTAGDGRIFTGTRDKFGNSRETQGATIALDAATGEELWRVRNVYPGKSPSTDGKVVICPMAAGPDRRTYALDAASGKQLWVTKTQGGSKPATILGDRILLRPWGGRLYAVNRKDGRKLWDFDLKAGTGCCPPVVSGGYAYVGSGCPTGNDSESVGAWSLIDAPRTRGVGWTLHAVDLGTGKGVWRFGTGDNVCGEPAVAYGRLYAVSRDGRIYCFAPAKPGEPTVPESADKSPNAPVTAVSKLLAEKTPLPKGWPMQGGTPERAGVPGTTLKTPLAKAWEFPTGGRVCTAAAIVGGRVYVGSDSGKILALDAVGRKLWEFKTGGKVRCSPAVAGGVVYCGSDDGKFYALDAASGAKKWEFECGGPVRASPAISAGVVVFGADDHHVYALNRKTGKKLWSFRGTHFMHVAPPVVVGKRVFAASWLDFVRALDIETGKELWKSYVPISAEALAHYRGKLYLRTPYYVMELDPASGKRLRLGNASYGYGGLAFMKSVMFQSGVSGQYGTSGGTSTDLGQPGKPMKRNFKHLEDVRMLSSKGLKGWPRLASMGAPLVLGETVCFATRKGELIITKPDGSRVWTAKLGGFCHSPPVAAADMLVAGCDDGKVYAFRSKSP